MDVARIRRFFRSWDVGWYSIALGLSVWFAVEDIANGDYWFAATVGALGLMYAWLLHKALDRALNRKESAHADQVP